MLHLAALLFFAAGTLFSGVPAPVPSSFRLGRSLAAESAAYELYAPRALRLRALVRALAGALIVICTFGRLHA